MIRAQSLADPLMQTDLDRAMAFVSRNLARQAIPIDADELKRLRESHAELLDVLKSTLNWTQAGFKDDVYSGVDVYGYSIIGCIRHALEQAEAIAKAAA